MRKPMTCEECGADLPVQEGRGRRRRLCAECTRTKIRGRERARYHADAEFRESQLAGRRNRYARNLDHERERSRTYYEANREEILAKRREKK